MPKDMKLKMLNIPQVSLNEMEQMYLERLSDEITEYNGLINGKAYTRRYNNVFTNMNTLHHTAAYIFYYAYKKAQEELDKEKQKTQKLDEHVKMLQEALTDLRKTNSCLRDEKTMFFFKSDKS